MNSINDSTQPQFNSYKYTELADKLSALLYDLPEHQKQLGIETLLDCCWSRSIQSLSEYWQKHHQPPELPTKCMSLLHYNIRHFYSNQVDLVDMINNFAPSIISLNELGTTIPKKTIKQLLYSYNVFQNEGTNSHGGVVLAVDKRLPCHPIETNQPNIVAVRIRVDDQQLDIASIYSPPTEKLPLAIMSDLVANAKNIILVGDLNAKHRDWECQQVNPKGRELADWITQNNLNVLNSGIRTSLRSNTTIDLVISNDVPDVSESKALPYNGSDHLPILTKLFRWNVFKDKYLVPRTYWKLYSSILSILADQFQIEQDSMLNSANDSHQWFISLEKFMYALKLPLTTWKEIKRKRPSISPSLQVLLHHKHYLQNRYRHSRQEEDRLRLRSWNAIVKREFQSLRQRSWDQFIANVASPNPTSFWRTVKKLSKKKSVDFSALTESNTIHRSPVDIVECLTEHFTARHASPTLTVTNPLDKEADELWKYLTRVDLNPPESITDQNDLQYKEEDIKSAIRSLKNKNSSSFDQVSNKMVKLLPPNYYSLLTRAYNVLFSHAFWGVEWKIARTICLNKTNDPAPTTNQLRPISMLPTFSKIYERLFLTRFNKWSVDMNILPSQQSGARPHQATTSRVNCLLEQITQAQSYCSFVPVIYIDFMQAFDKLWHQGLMVKLKRLNCPSLYLSWLANYFSNRILKIDYGDVVSSAVHVERGAPQGSCLGPVMYVICHYDLPLCFSDPTHVHAYVDDIAIAYAPSIYLKRKLQIIEIEERMNKDMLLLSKYATDWFSSVKCHICCRRWLP